MHDTIDLAQYGAVGAFALLFLSGIIILFRMYIKTRDKNDDNNVKLSEDHTKKCGEWERKAVDLHAEYERKMLDVRAEYERKHREIAEQTTKDIRELYEDNRKHEDELRKEHADLVNGIAGDYTRSLAEITRVLDKIHDRFIGPRARTRKD